MIAPDRVHAAVADVRHQRIALRGVAKRRRALGHRAEPLHVLAREHEVVRAGFGRHIDAARARLRHQRQAAAAAHVDDVQGATGLSGEIERGADRVALRTRPAATRDSSPPSRARGAGDWPLDLGVHGDRQAERGRAAHAFTQRREIDVREVVDAARGT